MQPVHTNSIKYSKIYFVSREERDALVARQIALSLEREERQRERELQELMRLQLRLGDEAMQQEVDRRAQEEKDEVWIREMYIWYLMSAMQVAQKELN